MDNQPASTAEALMRVFAYDAKGVDGLGDCDGLRERVDCAGRDAAVIKYQLHGLAQPQVLH
jgi:hypothetical protein